MRYYLPRALELRDVFLVRTPAGIDDLHADQCSVPELCLGASAGSGW
nr:hypothetical protein [Streptomyces antibioticus]